MSKQAVRLVYKELHRYAKLLDRHAGLKALLSPRKRPDSLLHLLGSRSTFYLPGSKKYTEILRSEFRAPISSPENVGDRLGLGLSALRYIGTEIQNIKAQAPDIIEDTASTSQYSASTSSNFEIISKPEVGSVLIAHPQLQGIFRHAVILITEYSEEEGASGLMLNKMHDYRGTQRLDSTVEPDARKALEQFGGKPLWLGGPVLYSEEDLRSSLKNSPPICLYALHKWSGVPEAKAIGHGVYSGGVWANIGQWGTLARNDARLFVGKSAWAPMQLESELTEGVWILAKPKSEFIFTQVEDPDEEEQMMEMPIPIPLSEDIADINVEPVQPTYSRIIRPPFSIKAPPTPQPKPPAAPAKASETEAIIKPKRPEPPKIPPGYQPHDSWRDILSQLGGEYASFAGIPRNIPPYKEDDDY